MKMQILNLILFLSLAVSILSFTGCVTVEQTIYLGDVEANGPLITPPSHVDLNNEVGSVTVSPKFSFVGEKSITGSTNDRYNSTFNFPDGTNYTAHNENLLWNLSNYTAGVDINIKLHRSYSVFGGVNLSEGNNKNFTGGYLGIGFHTDKSNPAMRFDLGLNVQNFDYYAVTIVNTKTTSFFGSSDSTKIFLDKGSSTNFNPFFSLTINSTNNTSAINYFGTLGFFTQSILNFHPGETRFDGYLPPLYIGTTVDQRASFTNYFLYLNPGLNLNLNPKINLLLSAKVIKDISLSSNKFIVVPSMQMDFQF